MLKVFVTSCRDEYITFFSKYLPRTNYIFMVLIFCRFEDEIYKVYCSLSVLKPPEILRTYNSFSPAVYLTIRPGAPTSILYPTNPLHPNLPSHPKPTVET